MYKLQPKSTEEVRKAVITALTDNFTLEIVGGGSKRGYGGPIESDKCLSTSSLSGILEYLPNELVLTARAGTELNLINEVLKENGQELSFEPPDWGPLLDNIAANPTIGGTIAANLSGPRRFTSGAARDHLLGLEMVTGRGEIIRTGGKVVKNVTGYDLCKLLAGSFGTLGVITEISIKVQPAAEKVRTILIKNLTDLDGIKLMSEVLGFSYGINGAAFLPKSVVGKSTVDYLRNIGASALALRIEGFADSVLVRCQELRERLRGFGDIEELHYKNSRVFWKEIADVSFFHSTGKFLWKVLMPPASGAAFVHKLRSQLSFNHFFDWGGGLVWVQMSEDYKGIEASLIRSVAKEFGGQGILVRGSASQQSLASNFEPLDPDLALLSKKIKEAFDPQYILNPGRNLSGTS